MICETISSNDFAIKNELYSWQQFSNGNNKNNNDINNKYLYIFFSMFSPY